MVSEIQSLLGMRQVPISVVQLGADFSVRADRSGDTWTAFLGLADGGSVLIRPDQHILAMFERTSSPHDVAKALAAHLDLSLAVTTPPSIL